MTKIYISGGPGSGKTTYAKKMSKRLGIPCFDLDNIKWINEANCFNKRRPKEERAALLNNILQNNPDWICEGVYFQDWIIPVLEQCDKIIILKPSIWVRSYRIVKRSFQRRFHIIPQKHKESLKNLFDLLNWSKDYDTKYLPVLMEKIRRLNKSYEMINGKTDYIQ